MNTNTFSAKSLTFTMYFVTRRKTLISCLAVLVVVSIAILYTLQKNAGYIREPYLINWTLTDTISCHYVTEGDALTSTEDIVPDSIFFHETSCRGGLNSRQACAIESVARIHPERNIYVFFNSPVSEMVLKRSCLSKLVEFRNVKLVRLHTAEYTRETALGDMLAHRGNNQSMWKIEHTADLLRYVTLYKYGGVYLDTDMLVVRPLDALGKNWAAREDDSMVNVAAMAIGKDELGHNLLGTILDNIKSDFRPDEWVYNGPGAMNRVLLNFCNATTIPQLSASICHGFEVYNPEVIYPIHWTLKETYFRAGDLPNTTEQAYTHHLWNRLTHDLTVTSDSPFDKLAKKYCPTIRHMFGEHFGT